MNKPKVSIVVVNHNGKNLLEALLKSISKSDYKNHEILVVDNNSTDGSREFVKKTHKNAKLVENKENLGYVGINSALRYCKGEYILFLNNDMELDKNCIKNLVKNIESDKNAAMAAPKLVNFYNKKLGSGGTWVSRAFYNGHIKGSGKDAVREIPYLGVGLIKKDFVEKFGYLFDPDYFIYAEDLDLGLRVRLNGKKILFEPNAIMYHMHALTTQKASKAFTTFLMERNSLITLFKVLSLKNILIFLPYAKLMRFLAVIKDLLSLNFGNAFARIKAFFWVASHMGLIYKKRKAVQKFRKSDDRFILKVFREKYMFRKKFIV